MVSQDTDPRPTANLLTDALTHLSKLVRGEMALARAETEAALRGALRGLLLVVCAAVFAITAFGVLTAALIAALIEAGLDPSIATLSVGVVFLLAAVICALTGMAALKPSGLVPDRTLRNIVRDAQTLKEGLRND